MWPVLYLTTVFYTENYAGLNKQKLLYHFSMYPTVGLVSTVFDVGGIFGGPLLGYVTDRSRHGPLNAIFKTSTNDRF